MRIESEKLNFVPVSVQTAETDGRAIHAQLTVAGREISPPPAIAHLVVHILQSQNLSDAVRVSRMSQYPFSFRLFLEALTWVCDQSLLINTNIKQYVENSASEYRWPRSISKTSLLKINIAKVSPHNATPALAFILALVFTPLIFQSKILMIENIRHGFQMTSALQTLLVFLFTLSAARTLQALALTMFLRLLRLAHQIDFVVTPFSIHIEINERAHPDTERAIYRIPLLIGAALPLSLMKVFGVLNLTADHLSAIALGLVVWLYFEFTPFSESELTMALKDLYAWMKQKTKAGFVTIHVALGVLWTLSLGIFLALYGPNLARSLWFIFMNADTKSEQAGAFISLIVFALVVLSFIDDIINAIAYGGDETNSLLQRIWKPSTTKAPRAAQTLTDKFSDPDFFRALPIVRFFPEEAQNHLRTLSRLVTVAEGTVLCRRGDQNRDLYILLEGELNIIKRRPQRRIHVATLSPTSVFGEIGFFLGYARTADIVATAQSTLVRVQHDSSFQTLNDKKMLAVRNIVWALQALNENPALGRLPSDTLDLIIKRSRFGEFAQGHWIAREGEHGEHAIVIIEGEVDVYQNETLIRKLKRGDISGEIALFKRHSQRTASLKAATAVLALVITRDQFWELLQENLSLAIQIEKVVSERLHADRVRAE